MGKKNEGQAGPPGKRRPQRDRRPGRAGIGPGPAYRPSSTGGGTRHQPGSSTGDCCPMVAAVKSVKKGKFRLARRYAAMSVRIIAERSAHAVARS